MAKEFLYFFYYFQRSPNRKINCIKRLNLDFPLRTKLWMNLIFMSLSDLTKTFLTQTPYLTFAGEAGGIQQNGKVPT